METIQDKCQRRCSNLTILQWHPHANRSVMDHPGKQGEVHHIRVFLFLKSEENDLVGSVYGVMDVIEKLHDRTTIDSDSEYSEYLYQIAA
mmetsp:Transcript_33816/g.40879  ORF Transcript_33816/g.40879 Transcript_33816/m.40879 type:complete len:90 (-) Transcript_33816:392-661(-)